MVTRVLSLLVAAALVLAGCGDDDAGVDGGEGAMAEAIAAEMRGEMGLSGRDAACAAQAVVDAVGEDRLRDAGFPEVESEDVDAALSGEVAGAFSDALDSCVIDLDDLLTADDGGDGSVTASTSQASSDISVVDRGFSTYEWTDERWATAAVELRNDGEGDGASVEVTMTLRDAEGTALATQTVTVDYVPPAGGEAYAVANFWSDLGDVEPVELDVQVNDEEFPSEGVALEVSVRDVELDEDGATIRGSVANPGEERVDFITVHCVLLGDSGIVGGVQGSVDPIAPGSDVAFEVGDSFDEEFSAEAADCTAGASIT